MSKKHLCKTGNTFPEHVMAETQQDTKPTMQNMTSKVLFQKTKRATRKNCRLCPTRTGWTQETHLSVAGVALGIYTINWQRMRGRVKDKDSFS